MQLPIDRKASTLKRALFLCDDNHHTSRFCEELFNSFARTEGLNWQAASRGVLQTPAALHDDPMSELAVASLRRLGVAPVNTLRLPLELSEFDLQMSDLVVAIGPASHVESIEARWPEWAARIERWSPTPNPESSAGLTELGRRVGRLVASLEARAPCRLGAAPPSTEVARQYVHGRV